MKFSENENCPFFQLALAWLINKNQDNVPILNKRLENIDTVLILLTKDKLDELNAI